MQFAHIQYILGFWIIAGLALFFIAAYKNKTRALYRFAQKELLNEIAFGVNQKRQKVKFLLILIGLSFGVIALMRPQWGFQWQEVKRRGIDIIVAFDTSKSMLATDVKPNRLERSKLAVKDLVKKLKGDRIGLVAFAGTAFVQCPLTLDYNGLLLALDDLTIASIPYGGTSLAQGIETAMKGFEGGLKNHAALIIITDGEDHQGNVIAAAEKAKKAGIKIFCIGIGTRDGELIQFVDEQGKQSFIKDREGNVVKSRLNEEILEKIAAITGGSYVRASGADFGLDLIYEGRIASMEKKEMKAQMSRRFYERFQFPLALAIIFLLGELFVSDRKKQ